MQRIGPVLLLHTCEVFCSTVSITASRWLQLLYIHVKHDFKTTCFTSLQVIQPLQFKNAKCYNWTHSFKFISNWLHLCRDRACLHPAAWPHRDQQWGPQDTATALCLVLGCLELWTHPGRGRPPSRFSRFSSNRTATSSKSELTLVTPSQNNAFVLKWLFYCHYFSKHEVLGDMQNFR